MISPEQKAAADRRLAERRTRPKDPSAITSDERVVWSYGPFRTPLQGGGITRHITEYRLRIMFVDGEVVEWTKSAPVEPQP